MSRRDSRARNRRVRTRAAAAVGTSGGLRRHWTVWPSPIGWGGVLIAVLVFTVFCRVILNGYTNWDDDVNLTKNPFLHPPSLGGLGSFWTHFYHFLYVPLVYSTYTLDMWLGGGKPWLPHLTNLVLHVFSALVVFRIALRLSRDRLAGAVIGATVGALVFAMHPIQVEAVAWLTGRKDVLSGLFSLLGILEYIQWRAPSGSSGRRRLHYALGLVCFGLSILAKPSAVALPLALISLDVWYFRIPLKSSAAALWPWFCVSMVWTLFTMRAQPIPEELARSMPAWFRPVVAADALVFYVRKLVFPVDFSPVYGRVPRVVMSSPWGYVSLVIITLAGAGVYYARNRWSAAAGVFVSMLVPVLGFVPFLFQAYSTVADRYVYVSMLGVAIAVAWGVRALHECRIAIRRIGTWAAGIVLVGLAGASFHQAAVWKATEKDPSISLWTHAVRFAPRIAGVHNNLGMAYLDAGQSAQAAEHFREALMLDPDHVDANTNLGNSLLRDGKTTEALEHFRRVLHAKPDFAEGHLNIANAFVMEGDYTRAIPEYKTALQLDSHLAAAHRGVGVAYMAAGSMAEAEQELRVALALDGSQVESHLALAMLLEKQGRTAAAADEYKRVLELSPDNDQARLKVLTLQTRSTSP